MQPQKPCQWLISLWLITVSWPQASCGACGYFQKRDQAAGRRAGMAYHDAAGWVLETLLHVLRVGVMLLSNPWGICSSRTSCHCIQLVAFFGWKLGIVLTTVWPVL